MLHKHLQYLFNPVDEMLKHDIKEKILKSHWLTTYHRHDLHQSQNADHFFLEHYFFPPHVTGSVSMSCGHSDLKL